MTRMYVNTKIRLRHVLDNRLSDRGQGTLEYLGIVIIAVALVGAVIAAVNGFGLQAKITGFLNQIGTPAGGSAPAGG